MVTPELSSLMGSPREELAQASRIYAELLARGGMGDKTMERLDKVMGDMGADTRQLKARLNHIKKGDTKLPSCSKPKAKAPVAKEKARSKTKTQAQTKPKTKPKPKPAAPVTEELPRPEARSQTPGKPKAGSKDEVTKKAEKTEALATTHCPLCGKDAEPEWPHCPWCGGELPPHCPICEREMAPDWRFCPYFGQE